MGRIDKENYYLDIAQTVAGRSTCLRRCYGAILVKSDEIISTGYNGAPRGRRNCVDLNYCTREALHPLRGAVRAVPLRPRRGQRHHLRRPQRGPGRHPLHGLRGAGHRDADSRLHLLLHVPPPHHQRRHRPGGHPGHPHGVPGGRCGRLGAGGRLPAPIPLRPRAAEIDSEQECS